METGWKPNVEASPTCPRCGSSSTKFCYYNNYSLTQPRYFCKGCRRYWTKGGSLRNVPVGGGCRKSRRIKQFLAPCNGNPLRDDFSGGAPAALGHNRKVPIISNGSMAAADEGPNIDLALVYANFLSQKPGPEAEPELDASGGPFFGQFSKIDRMQMNLMSDQLSQENEFVEFRFLSDRSSYTQFSNQNELYFSGLESIEKQQSSGFQFSSTTMNQVKNFMLPPLPDDQELTVSEGMMWSGSDQIIFPGHANLFSGIEPQAQEQNQLDENGSQFDVSIELCNVSRL